MPAPARHSHGGRLLCGPGWAGTRSEEDPMIDYTHPRRRPASVPAPVETATVVPATGHAEGVRLRAGQSISLLTVVAQQAATARARAVRTGQ